MYGMFWDATSSNQDIGSWNTAKVNGMAFMFRDVTAFNQDIGDWVLVSMGQTLEGADAGSMFSKLKILVHWM